jgi:transcription elongation factor GreA
MAPSVSFFIVSLTYRPRSTVEPERICSRHPRTTTNGDSSFVGIEVPNMVEKTYPMTREGLERLKKQLEELRTVKRREVAERIHAAREFQTTQNNPEYEDAKSELELIEARIRQLEEQLQRAVIIDEERAHHASAVMLGSTVTVTVDGADREYTIVGSAEADPAQGRISNESPVGRALLGKRVGDEVQVVAPRGIMKMKVKAIH